MRRIIGLFFVCAVTTGCTVAANLPLPLALLRLPITIDTQGVGKEFDVVERCRLQVIADAVANGSPLRDAIKQNWEDTHISPCRRSRKASTATNSVDAFDDLMGPKTVVLVAISGGGSRAAALAAHTLSLLERKFNELSSAFGGREAAMLGLIDGFSTVSGGSIYAYQIARTNAVLERLKDRDRESRSKHPASATPRRPLCMEGSTVGVSVPTIQDLERCFFQHADLLGQEGRNVGFGGVKAYFLTAMGDLKIPLPGPLITLSTDLNYLDILAWSLTTAESSKLSALIHDLHPEADARTALGVLRRPTHPWAITFGDLRPLPRFFFNTTALETGLPFVLTQRITHLPSPAKTINRTSGLIKWTSARLDEPKDPKDRKPLGNAFTLEEINSSPAEFPLAYAAMASAAFPIGIEPLKVLKHNYDHHRQTIDRTAEWLQLSDGGIYDNSGLTTISRLVAYLSDPETRRNVTPPPRFVILSINAEVEDYDLHYPARPAPEPPWYERGFLKYFNLKAPVRIEALGVRALQIIHFTNKRRAKEIAIAEISNLFAKQEVGKGPELHYLPVSFSQLSEHDRLQIPDPEQLFRRIKKVPTSYGISQADDLLIAQAAALLVSSTQPKPFKLGPACGRITRLDEAFAFALIEKANGDEPSAQMEKTARRIWCESTAR